MLVMYTDMEASKSKDFAPKLGMCVGEIVSRINLGGVFKRISGVKVFNVLIETCK